MRSEPGSAVARTWVVVVNRYAFAKKKPCVQVPPLEGFTSDLLTMESTVTQHCTDLNVPGCRPFKLVADE